jgi:cytochrome P450
VRQDSPAAYEPPRTHPLTPIIALFRTILRGDGDLLSLLPAAAYRMKIGPLGYSRRSILIINSPELFRSVLTDPTGIYPKNDLMTGALEPLVGDSIFVSSGERWRRQRRMIDPAFSHIRVGRAFTSMVAAVDDYCARLDAHADTGAPFSLDLAMSHLTADVICRTIFSTSLESRIARDVFDAFSVFERSAAHVELRRLIFDAPFSRIPQHATVLDACERIRRHLGELVDPRLASDAPQHDDIAAAVIAARDPETGEGFSREELIDQLGVFFLAGHETTASVLTWVFFILAVRPEVVARMREEIDRVVGAGPVNFEHVRKLPFVRNVFRETLRLYPPITFIPRVAAEATRIGKYRVKRGAMLMISPWAIHRNETLWKHPHRFDPDRFNPEREKDHVPGAYLPFGLGPRVCVGADFATVEATLIIARLVRRYDFSVDAPERVRPAARLTTRPAEEILCRVRRSTRAPGEAVRTSGTGVTATS